MNQTIPGRLGNWILTEKLGSGYSGSIYRAYNPFTLQVAAIKVQHIDHECPTNRYERAFYPLLQRGEGMPTLLASGVQGIWDYLVIELLGPSLDNLYRRSGKHIMDLRSVICVAMQVLTRLQCMHARGILHRDIQLGNCVIGIPPNEQTLYMIDFGFSKQYIDPTTRRHIPDSHKKRDFIGNYWFTSVNVHCKGKVPSRRDDVEALALMLIHLLTLYGLPWTRNGVPTNDEQCNRVIRQKLQARPEDLCRGLPEEFEEFLRYCRRLKFLDQPDYQYWREQFAQLAIRNGWGNKAGEFDDAFIWPPPMPAPPAPPPQRKPTAAANELTNILEGIAKMNLNEHQIPGAAKANVVVKTEDQGTRLANGKTSKDPVAVANSDQDSSADDASDGRRQRPPLAARLSKAAALTRLTNEVPKALTNNDLARILRQFIEIMRANRSKVVTLQGFSFLQALIRQLADPSIFLVSEKTLADVDTNARGDRHNARLRKSATLRALRKRVVDAPASVSNTSLAEFLSEFCAHIKKTTAKNLTEEGMAVLVALETRLKG